MSDTFFGTFLLGSGAITTEQLQDAVLAQKQDRVLLGQIAVDQGMLTYDELQAVLTEQQMSGNRFGQIAREKGLLTEEQFRAILQVQSGNHLLLGEALVRKGYLSAADLNLRLREFDGINRAKEAEFSEQLSRHPRGPILHLCLDITRSYLGRLGYATKCGNLTYLLPEGEKAFPFFLEQSAGPEKQYLGIHLSRVGMRTMLGEEGGSMSLVEQHDEISQLLFNLNYIICEDLRKQGFAFKHGAVQSHPPDSGHHLCVRLSSFIDTLYITYSFD